MSEVLDMNSMGYFIPQTNAGGGIVAVIVLSIIAAVILAIVFLPKSKRGKYSGLLNDVYEFLHFTKYWIPSIVRFIYLFIICYAVIGGLYTMFAISFWLGLMTMIVPPVISRLVIEGLLVLYSIREELVRIRQNLEKKNQE